MNHQDTFPRLDLRGLAIRDQLLSIYHKGSWLFAIQNALVNHTHPFSKVLQMIMDQYNAAPDEVLDVIPKETINKIKEFTSSK